MRNVWVGDEALITGHLSWNSFRTGAEYSLFMRVYKPKFPFVVVVDTIHLDKILLKMDDGRIILCSPRVVEDDEFDPITT